MQCVLGRLALRAALSFLPCLLLAQSESHIRQSQHAKQLMAEGRFADAAPIYEELVRALPSNTGLRLNLGLAYHMSGRHRESIPEFERVLKSDPNNIPALLSLGATNLELNQPARAVTPLRKFVRLQPQHVPARGMLANALLALEQPKEAATHFRKLTTLTPDDPQAWYGLGRAYEALARVAFAELEKTASGSAEWLALVAESRLPRRQYRSAFYFYKQALDKNPHLPGVHAGLAEVYRKTERPDWAAVEEKREAALPKPDCLRDKAPCAFAAGRFLDAAASPSPFWRTRAYNQLAMATFAKLWAMPPSVPLHALKAEILSNNGNPLEAVQEWKAAQKLAPGDPAIERELALALFEAHDYVNALPLLEAELKKEPESAPLHFMIGDSWLRQEQPEKGLTALERAIQLDPKLLPAHASLGLAYARLGKTEQAVPHLTAALELDEDGALHYQLARALQRSGDAERAKQMMAKYQAITQRSEAEKGKLEEEAKITAP